jgi:hypothetical protein
MRGSGILPEYNVLLGVADNIAVALQQLNLILTKELTVRYLPLARIP